jgi:recombination associated protein RdgC
MAIKRESRFLEDHMDEVYTQTLEKNFIGREFLTWLWYFTENDEGRFEVELGQGKGKGKNHPAQVWLDDRIVLSAKTGRSHEHIIRGGVPSTSDEAAVSLKTGKSVKELKIALEVNGIGPFVATLTGDDLTPRGLKLPEPDKNIDATPIEQRIEYLATFTKGLETLFAKFMDERTDKLWETNRINSIRTWIQTRNHDASTIH